MSEQERRVGAQELLQTAVQTIAQKYGMTIEATLQVETISEGYATSRAVLVLKPLPNWQPYPEVKDSDSLKSSR